MQRAREYDALFSLDSWDVELVSDEQWGRVLVAQRNFQPGEVVVRSGVLFRARSAADCMRQYHDLLIKDRARYGAMFDQYIEWANGSPRWVHALYAGGWLDLSRTSSVPIVAPSTCPYL
jgi:hypothetical protein